MFAPPPIQLSREEIERRLSEHPSRERQASPTNRNDEAKSISLLRRTSPGSWPRRNNYFGRPEKAQVSSPITAASQAHSRGVGKCHPLQSAVRADIQRLYSLPPGFAESPRKAPTPPTRRLSTRPGDPSLPPSPLWQSVTTIDQPGTPQSSNIAPPTTLKSSNRESLAGHKEIAHAWSMRSPGMHENSQPIDGDAIRQTQGEATQSYERAYIMQSARPHIVSMAQRKRVVRAKMAGLGLDISSEGGDPKKTDKGDVEIAKEASSATSAEKRRSAEEMHFSSRELPDTPSGTAATPTEVYHNLEGFKMSSSRRRRRRRSRRKSATHARFKEGEKVMSPNRLSAIMEDADRHDGRPASLESSAPTATILHLRGGSLVTVTPPELTPWLRYIYVEGPANPSEIVSIPRKPSVASLDLFQDAIDGFQKGAVPIPRRRSDDQVLDDVCDFFDGFGFDSVSFAGDSFNPAETGYGGGAESNDGAGKEIERFSTPPTEPENVQADEMSSEDAANADQSVLDLHLSRSSKAYALMHSISRSSEATQAGPSVLPHYRKDSETLAAASSRLPQPHGTLSAQNM